MSDLVQATFDYGVLDTDTQVFLKVKAEAIQSRLKRTAEDIIAIGQDLKEAQERLSNNKNGMFRLWIKSEFEMSDRSAYRFIHVAERFNELYCGNLPQYNISVLYELAAPSTSDNIIEQVQSGEIPPTLEAIKAAKKAEEEARKAEEEAEKAAQELSDLIEAALAREGVARQQLFTAQSERQQLQVESDKLTQQIEDLQAKIADLSSVKKETVEVEKIVEKVVEKPVISPEAQTRIKKLEDEVAALQGQKETLTRQRDNLSKQCSELASDVSALMEANEIKAQEELYIAKIRQKWIDATDLFEKQVSNVLQQLPSPIDTQYFDANDWHRLEHVKEQAHRFLQACESLSYRPSAGVIHNIIDAFPA